MAIVAGARIAHVNWPVGRRANVCAAAKSKRPSERALKRQNAFKEATLQHEVPEFFEAKEFVSKSARAKRREVLGACLNTSAVFVTLGTTGSVVIPAIAGLTTSSFSPMSLPSVQTLPTPDSALLAVGAGVAVTAARTGLAAVWPALRESNDAANNQVRPRSTLDSVSRAFYTLLLRPSSGVQHRATTTNVSALLANC